MDTPNCYDARIVDCNCLFGPWPRADLDTSLDTVTRLLAGAHIHHAMIASLRAATYEHRSGNAEAREACAGRGDLTPAAGLVLGRTVDAAAETSQIADAGFPLLRLFREYQGWPMDYRPFEQVLSVAAERELVLMVAALLPGDITALGRLLTQTPCSVVVTGVNTSHTPLVAEAIAVGRDVPGMHFETSRLEGIDTIDVMARELGAQRLVFGTALPFQYPTSAVMLVAGSSLSESEKAAVFGKNLAALLNRADLA